MEDILKHLLEAESRAETIVEEAEQERARIIQQALDNVKQIEDRFEAGLPELRISFTSKAEERAAQEIAGMQRRYDERSRDLRSRAEQREEDALAAAIALITDPGHH